VNIIINKIIINVFYYIKYINILFKYNKQYEIKAKYIHRKQPLHHEDINYKDEWQKEVYEFAINIAEINKYITILDYGCGSAFKLIKYFEKYNFIGVEIEPTLAWLKFKYPNYRWLNPEELLTIQTHFDLVICSDVVEHIPDPDQLMTLFKKLDFKFIILSTPDRDLLKDKYHQLGPPANPTHCREWCFEEFEKYIVKHFKVIDHKIVNQQQATQVILCRKK
jgi:hypothetical protein